MGENRAALVRMPALAAAGQLHETQSGYAEKAEGSLWVRKSEAVAFEIGFRLL
ncbi:hypothetical protein GCM10020370_43040 [Paenibacillus hodogayensis]